MGDGFAFYIERMELMAFFAGYALIYTLIDVFFSDTKLKKKRFKINLPQLLPFAYALTGTLYLSLEIKNMFPDFSFASLSNYFQFPFIKLFGLLSVLFWIPAFSKKKILTLLHSLLFFIFLIKDLITSLPDNDQNYLVNNDMRIFTASILINAATLLCVVLLYLSFKRKKHSPAL